MRSRGVVFAFLGATAFACSNGAAPPAAARSGSSAAGQPSALASIAPQPTPSARPSASADAPTANSPPDLVDDHDFIYPTATPAPKTVAAFQDEVAKTCPEGSGETHQAIAAAIASAMQCRATIIDRDAAKLAGPKLASLLDADPKGAHASPAKRSVPSLWSRTTDAACRIELAQATVFGTDLQRGTMAQITEVSCPAAADLRLGVLMRTWTMSAPSDFVAYVRAETAQKPDPRPRIKLWSDFAERARVVAPHAVASACDLFCRWTDSDWIDFQANLESATDGARRLAASTCTAWPELAKTFGSEATCKAELEQFWLPSGTALAGSSDHIDFHDPKPDAMPVADPQLPPPVDAAYDRATIAMRRAWTNSNPSATASSHVTVTQWLDDEVASPGVTSRPPLVDFAKRFAPLRMRLGVIDATSSFFHIGDMPQGWDGPRSPFGEGLGQLLEGYFLRAIVSGDATALSAHLRGRSAWGAKVEAQLRAIEKDLRGPGDGAPANRTKYADMLHQLLEDGASIGSNLCTGVPELASSLAPDACAPLVEAYLFSATMTLGRAEILEKHP